VPRDRKVMAYPLIDDSIISPQDDNPQFVDFFQMIATDSQNKSTNSEGNNKGSYPQYPE
jgi:hypothetical protein